MTTFITKLGYIKVHVSVYYCYKTVIAEDDRISSRKQHAYNFTQHNIMQCSSTLEVPKTLPNDK